MPTKERSPRPALTKERVLAAAVDLVDRDGLGALTMRRLGGELGVEAMSLYKHVANKDEILDGIIERVVTEIEIPADSGDWRAAMRRRAASARDVLSRHSWAIGLLETGRSMGPAQMRYLDAILGVLRSAGFSVEEAGHAFWLLDAYVYGHVVQETNLSGSASQETAAPAASGPELMIGRDYPHLAEVAAHALGSPFSFDGEFEYGLHLILTALEPTTK